MKWEKFTKDNLPPAKTIILLWYKSGYHGAIEFFYSEEARDSHRKGMEWHERHPEGYESKIELLMVAQEIAKNDPITHWALFPEGPQENN